MKEVIATVQSKKQAIKLQEAIVVQGGWLATGKNDYGFIYSRSLTPGEHTPYFVKDKESLYIEKKTLRQWQIVKEQAFAAVTFGGVLPI